MLDILYNYNNKDTFSDRVLYHRVDILYYKFNTHNKSKQTNNSINRV